AHGFEPSPDVRVGRRVSASDGRERLPEVPFRIDGPRETDSLFPDALQRGQDDTPRTQRNPFHVTQNQIAPLRACELTPRVGRKVCVLGESTEDALIVRSSRRTQFEAYPSVAVEALQDVCDVQRIIVRFVADWMRFAAVPKRV